MYITYVSACIHAHAVTGRCRLQISCACETNKDTCPIKYVKLRECMHCMLPHTPSTFMNSYTQHAATMMGGATLFTFTLPFIYIQLMRRRASVG